ncbi:2-succinyl-6-hydroxy-2,4-cyclohexadiene-1-carboxylate synthase [Yersinia pseudotuberculosis IP 32953]|uniref:2-succinyl-6-hydroxy-2,4-cyclohexadiene-1-carboxylate synthase n=3 Tax=Yersinia pseudotuberculosis TaxID=633 RepID=MENH_YERPS|nr:2-succinyl-6-hydroxy-2,4-cyclohexadiene-1-carboxylate synthase [Yersinia pseudotuberculosis]B1JH89.1 RecName: Full=2-succinyl-6-hydroxy-2,4-cyclohexadiene-1-carboxylate synthase; Short=SHCHC synthase [Yersinia pseudotuberculosis YPIII]Q669C8.1 RecName: Full=2-succinyl-6-hydroxy-2,4-cyclohexadiene-1-carboxylate synthase; Short=SHCHC synthase [Yersinia pseudotuberculosis IP 32953]AIN12642.1 2-succinyl-6-hydroxy-2,4-cyclohexadiene-1-carboxylate synthase [Yersinia pseudotuberculosis]AJJ07020.1 2
MTTLACQKLAPHPESPRHQHAGPWLVWLHGLLGSGQDWLPVAQLCGDYPSLLIDLPGHGQSVSLSADGFADISRQLSQTLQANGIREYWLAGYSLGGRIAIYHACYGRHHGLQGLLVEGGNLGLENAELRQARLQQDRQWAQRFRQEPLPQVLDDWYQQAVFADLDPQQREQLVLLRADNHGTAVAEMLEATSLGHQPWLLPALQRLNVPYTYLCGDRDHKFLQLAQQYRLPLHTLARAGHNAHRANPGAFAAQVLAFLSQSSCLPPSSLSR